MFRSIDADQSGEKANNGLLGQYDTCLAINSIGQDLRRSEPGQGHGRVARSTGNGEGWIEINYDAIPNRMFGRWRLIPAVTFLREHFAPLSFDRQMTVFLGLTSVAASFLSLEMFGH